MSFEAMAWATKQRLPTNQKMVLVMLADRTNKDTGRCDPSYNRLAEDCGMHRRTLIRCIQSLEDSGHIRRVGRADENGMSRTNQYELAGCQSATPGCQSATGGGDTGPPGWWHSATRTSNTNQEVRTRGSFGAEAPALEVFKYWQSVMHKPRAKLTNDRRQKINARIKEGFTVTEIKRAIDGCASSSFHMGDNDDRKTYCDLTLILRNGSKVEQFQETAEQQQEQQTAGVEL